MRIKESYSKKHPKTNYAVERRLHYTDYKGEKGIDYLEDKGYQFVESRPDIGISKHGEPVRGISDGKSILLKGEPPIYYALWGRKLSEQSYMNQFLATMSTCKENGLDQYHFVIPRDFSLKEKYFKRDKNEFLCMILQNKKRNVLLNNMFPSLRKYKSHSLQNFRINGDKYFSKHLGPKLYHSYGRGWKRKCYKGRPENEFEVISKYQFNFCPENSFFRGYVTEKPINAMICGSIPIYYGAPDIERYIPEDCMIRYQDFSSFEDMVEYIENMSYDEYSKYLNNIEDFLTSKKSDAFSSVTFAKKLVKIIRESLI